MAVETFPIAFPTSFLGETSYFIEVPEFDVVRLQAVGVSAGPNDINVDRGLPRWMASWKTRPLYHIEIGYWRRFFAALRRGQRFFLGFDPVRYYPQAYMPKGWPTTGGFSGYAGAGTVLAINNSGLPGIGRDVLELGSLPVGLSLIAGDYVSLSQTVTINGASIAAVDLHRVLDPTAQVANGSGQVTVWVEPEIRTDFTTSAVALLQAPPAKFRLTKAELPVNAKGHQRPGQATFSATSTYV